jgi:hypothetical protein
MRLSSALFPYLSFLTKDGIIPGASKKLLPALRALNGVTLIKDFAEEEFLKSLYEEFTSEASPAF